MMKRSYRRACQAHLKNTFHLDSFRPGQKAAAYALLSGRDLLCILPTGAGKSLCWQLPAVVHAGLTVVVSPLIALMRDQVQHLMANGVPAVTLNSLMTSDERAAAMTRLWSGEISIVFVAPERLSNAEFCQLCDARPPWLVVVDEAHCVVQWGEEFRPAYAKIADFVRALSARPVLCAMTATADGRMQHAITDALGMRRRKRVLLPIVRPNLRYSVCTTLNRTGEILRLAEDAQGKMVVFCRSRNRAESLAGLMKSRGVHADHYHAGLARDQREGVQQRFQSGEIHVLTATTAFGMGVDIPDIRCVVHDYLPDTLIDYVQQSGRAGRDGRDADCVLLLEPMEIDRKASKLRRGLKNARWLISRMRHLRSEWGPVRELLCVLLTANCIPSAIAGAFGRRVRACGMCSACRHGPMLKRVPPLPYMTRADVVAFFLAWQRDAIAEQLGISRRKVLSDAEIASAAKRLVLPQKMSVHAAPLQRLLDHFLHFPGDTGANDGA